MWCLVGRTHTGLNVYSRTTTCGKISPVWTCPAARPCFLNFLSNIKYVLFSRKSTQGFECVFKNPWLMVRWAQFDHVLLQACVSWNFHQIWSMWFLIGRVRIVWMCIQQPLHHGKVSLVWICLTKRPCFLNFP